MPTCLDQNSEYIHTYTPYLSIIILSIFHTNTTAYNHNTSLATPPQSQQCHRTKS